ncbi:AraC family transcriptional regulator ligand-binding domain-containing protein [Robbsia sp. KACC 23696]|uniref:AraC family transcriptional regulator n=1 Tax=Robbsia sp. KACC 23696 TaxID=3149231 RepID=UPI00325B1A8C
MTRPTTFSIPPRALASVGLSLDGLCERAGIAVSDSWQTDDFFRLWAAADALLDDRSAGLRFGSEGVRRGHAVAAIVALHAPDFRHALAALSRYKRLTCPELVEIEIAGDEASVRYRWLQATGNVPRLLVDTTMASLNALARRGSGGRITPIRLELARKPADRSLLSQHFDCPIVFGTNENAMVFERTALDIPFVTADGGAFALLLHDFETRIAEGEGFSSVVGDLRVAIARQLSEGRRPGVAEIARRLNVSSRTLQRRLDASGTRFQDQLASVRRTMAGRLLLNTDFDAVAISMLLGFEEPNSFARAFRSWEQTTPQRWRARHSQNPLFAMQEVRP